MWSQTPYFGQLAGMRRPATLARAGASHFLTNASPKSVHSFESPNQLPYALRRSATLAESPRNAACPPQTNSHLSNEYAKYLCERKLRTSIEGTNFMRKVPQKCVETRGQDFRLWSKYLDCHRPLFRLKRHRHCHLQTTEIHSRLFRRSEIQKLKRN